MTAHASGNTDIDGSIQQGTSSVTQASQLRCVLAHPEQLLYTLGFSQHGLTAGHEQEKQVRETSLQRWACIT